ncbi:glycoside hydrolase domain-containing protein [Paenibacillus sp. CF384]|uniref:glycoside hydrolase domain-containing protein n=1 Tax=Paenibacillus sp. CF384 TaxID=1884382 RepID=UPI00089CD65E|nr:glycoside hydrolase domain-containing protein [Paenibacillus sp. CF384]SDX06080.1 alpha-1,2-mannosidase, putative [Paenibacillus sp. CF384]
MLKKLLAVVMTLMFISHLILPLSSSTVAAADDLGTALPVTLTKNVALNATVTASGQCNANEGAANAVDGKTDTKWCDNTAVSKKWLMLDLGKVYNINEWIVQNAAINESSNSPFWNTKDFRLQKSVDGSTWTDVDVVKSNVQTIVDRHVTAFSTRYVRLYIDKAAHDSNTVRLYELGLYGVDADQIPAEPDTNLEPVDYVDPFINTLGDNGQTNPGPSTPFGLVSLGPDSDGGGFSGYLYENKYIRGFSHLRFSGVGCSGAGGNILMMPETSAFTKNRDEYKQKYDKSSEQASAGYYGVTLASGIGVELTTSNNVGFHRYTFPSAANAGSVLVDLSNSYAGMLDASLKVESNNEITGMIKSQNVCGHGYYTIYYSIQFDHDFDSYSSWLGDSVGAVAQRTGSNSGVWVNFNTTSNKVVKAKVGLSTISVAQAQYERSHDVANWDFDAQHAKAKKAWSDALGKVKVTDSNEENKRVFYTQMYHTYLHPKNVTSSVGTFKAGRDETTIRNVSEPGLGEDFQYYNGWTTWDDFRKYALFSLFEPKRYDNMVKSLVDLYSTRGSYTQWGDGYWPSPTVRNEFNGAVILDAYAKGFKDFDVYKALKGMAVDADNFSVSDGEISGKLEKANSASFPMKLAQLVGDKATFDKYKTMALAYKNLWNANQVDEKGEKRGFFTPNGQTVGSGDILAVDRYAYQGNLWQYRWSAPQDINGLAGLMGGKTEMAKQLSHFFDIGEYMAINEEDLNAPYLFNYLGYPYLTQYYAREYTTEVVTQKYHNHGAYAYPMKSRVYRDDPEGYLSSMDDDAGGMSSWFVYSAMGLFPGNPGEADFLIGSPIFSEMELQMGSGKTLTIKADGVSSENRFIQSAMLNGKDFNQAWIKYEDLMAGGTLEFKMGNTPNTNWGAKQSATPPSIDYTADVNNTLNHEPMIAEQSQWKYLDKGQATGNGWMSLNFDDSSWASGQAMLGYDSLGKVKTKVSFGPDANNKYTTTYFRKTFTAKNVKDILELDASLIRDDGAVVYLNGKEVIRTNMPSGTVNYGTFANVTVADERDRNGFIIDPSNLLEGENVISAEIHQANGTSSDIAFEFSLEAVRKLTIPNAPTNPVMDDKMNTFGWTPVSGINQAADYQFSTDDGKSWRPVTSNPQTVGPLNYAAGVIQVRVKANAAKNLAAGQVLRSNTVYTSDVKWDVYNLKVDTFQDGSKATLGNKAVHVTGTLNGEYGDSAVVVVRLMDGSKDAVVSSAVPVQTGSFDFTQLYNVNASKYKINVYLVSEFNGDVFESPLWLAEPFIEQAEDGSLPDPSDPPVVEDPIPDPLPLPEKTPDEPDVPEIGLTVQFEDRAEMTTDLHPNGGPLGTEANNGGTVVSHTFNGAWLAYNIDFGTTGMNNVTVEYDSPTDKVPAGSKLEFRLDSVTGELVGTVNLEDKLSGWGSYIATTAQLNKTLTGARKLYVVMIAGTPNDKPYIGNFDWFKFGYEPIRSDYAKLELETYDEWSTDLNPVNTLPLKTEGGKSGQQVANTFNGAWLAYKRMDFGTLGVNQIAIEYSGNSTSCPADAAVEVRLGGVNGTLIGTVSTPPTAGSWGTYATTTAKLTQTVTGMQDVYLVLKGTTNGTLKYIGNFDNASFSMKVQVPESEQLEVEFENKTEWTSTTNPVKGGTLKIENNNGGRTIGNTFGGAWLSFKDVNFGTKGKNNIAIVYDAPTDKAPNDVKAEVRLGSVTGTLVGTVSLPNTGTGWGHYKSSPMAKLTSTITGMQDVYIVLLGTSTSALPYVGNFDKFTLYENIRTDYAKLELEKYDAWTTATNPFNGNTPLKTENGKSVQQVANTFNGAWLAYKRMDFGSQGVNQFSVEYSGNTASCPSNAAVEVRLGSPTGTLVGTLNTPPTANGWGNYANVTTNLSQPIAGVQDIYLVLTGTTTATYKYLGNFDNAAFAYIAP